MKHILIIGSANADYVIHTDRLPRLGETLPGRDFSVNIGGKGLNQAIAVQKLGGQAAFLGAVGHDMNGALLLKAMADQSISFHGICSDKESTGIALITVVKGDNCILLHPGANSCMRAEVIQEKKELIENAAAAIFQLEIPPEAVMEGIRIAHTAGVPVYLNPAPARDLPENIYPLIDYLIPNEHEAAALSGVEAETEEGCRENIRFFREKGVKNVLITRGEKGCAYHEEKAVHFCPAVKTTPVDTTSAGDTFIGAFCVQMLAGRNIHEAVKYACRAAAITVSRPGAAASIPTADEI
ncbi:MAG: ribokinase [Clostridia bacterium]|nr:ribokinase [Clostridia bacterium]